MTVGAAPQRSACAASIASPNARAVWNRSLDADIARSDAASAGSVPGASRRGVGPAINCP